MKSAGKSKLPPHVLAAVEEKARGRRLDERAHFWAEVEAARTGVGGARSHGRCLPDEESDLFPHLFVGDDDGGEIDDVARESESIRRREQIENAYDDIPVKVVDPLGEEHDGSSSVHSTPEPYPIGPTGVEKLCCDLDLVGVEPTTEKCQSVKETLQRRLSFSTLTPIQRHAIPMALSGRDLVCSAATGSGKTFAYLVPAVVKMVQSDANGVGKSTSSETKSGYEMEDTEDTEDIEVTASELPSSTSTPSPSGGYGRRRQLEDTAGDEDGDLIDVEDDEDSETESTGDTSEIIPPDEPPTPARPRVVVLVPTRELAAQVAVEARRVVFGTGYTVATLHGGQSVKPQLEQLAFAPEIVVSTPGRLLSCVADEKYLDLSNVKTLILDEADQMVDMGFAPQVFEICQGGSCAMPAPAPMLDETMQSDKTITRGFGRQTLLFSATFPPAVRRLALDVAVGGQGSGAPPPARIAVGRVGSTVAGIKQTVVLSPSHLREKKFPLLVDALVESSVGANSEEDSSDDISRVLVFCAGKSTAAWVRSELTKLLDADTLMSRARGVPVPKTFAAEELHGDCSQGARSRALDAFATGACRILVATDVASRGLDLPRVTTVINFDLPTDGRDFDSYVHRIGRTGRAGRSGSAISLYHPGFSKYEGNGFIYRPLLELMSETKQDVPDWFLSLPDAQGNPHSFHNRSADRNQRDGSFGGGPPMGRGRNERVGGASRGRRF